MKNYKKEYDKLLKIKKPVLIEVYSMVYRKRVIKYRILYPNGKCEYVVIICKIDRFRESCFSKDSLEETVKSMKEWDGVNRKIKIKDI